MAWVKIDDQFYAHPKLIAAGPLAKCLFVDALCYANQYLTDGFIPATVALQISMPLAQYTDAATVIGLLVQADLWHEVDGGYRIHDYLDYNPSRDHVLKERAAAKERMQRVRGSKPVNNDEKPRSPEVRPNNERTSPEVQKCSPYPVPDPVPVPPVPTEQGIPPIDPPASVPPDGGGDAGTKPEPVKAKRATRFSPDAVLTEEWRGAAVNLGYPAEHVDWLFDEFRDYWCSVSGKNAARTDWLAVWRNRVRDRVERGRNLTRFQPRPAAESPNGSPLRKRDGLPTAAWFAAEAARLEAEGETA